MSKYALLTNDSLNAATMKVNGISNIASNDKDFERIRWIEALETLTSAGIWLIECLKF
jgi:predicted nucleic acid-binding protein